ncbi:MAG TPA: hypothetical protein VFY05_04805 [Candidatus Angelobacter sp.]|nr:hypothetical protein [Candidatus Angelobacter sp.]
MFLLRIPVLYLWLAMMAGLAILAVEVYRQGLRRTFPAFSLYVYISLAKCVILFVTSKTLPGFTYDVAYYAGTFVHAALVTAVGVELYLKTFGTKIAAPAWVPRKTLNLVLLVIGVAFLLGLGIRATNGGRFTQAMVTCEQIMILGSLLSLLAMAAFSRRLKISWNKTAAEIWVGFVLFLLVNSVTAFVRGSGSQIQALVAIRVGALSYILSLAWWRWRLATPCKDPANAAMLSYHGRQREHS